MDTAFDDDPPRGVGDGSERPPSLKHLSKTPSWIMLGFVIGAVFVFSLPRRQPEPQVIYVPAEEDSHSPVPMAARQEADFTLLEAVFAEWQQYAVWDDDTTEVALWDSESGQYTRLYEVRRALGAAGEGIVFYYRSIPALTRPLLTRGVSASAPLLFTEPDALRKAWLRQRDEETWGAIQESIRQLSPPKNEAPPAPQPAFP